MDHLLRYPFFWSFFLIGETACLWASGLVAHRRATSSYAFVDFKLKHNFFMGEEKGLIKANYII